MAVIELDISETSKTLAVLGGYVVIFGLVSYILKERLFISDSILALAVGIALGPIGSDWISPWRWTGGDEEVRNEVTFQVARIAIGLQVLFCGISLPKAYLKRAWKSLLVLIGPVMTVAWLVSGAFIYALIPGISYLDSLVIGAAVAPTDPVLANAIVQGRFAEEHVPRHVREILAAESGANDGLGVPFIYLAIYIQRRLSPTSSFHTLGQSILRWFLSTILYEICLSIVMGAVIGYIARKTLKEAEKREFIDHESFLAYGVGLTFFTLGVVGMIGSDDLLACFIAGNSFTWDDWFRVETEDHSFQNVIDQLLNSAVFIYIGSIIPWSSFGDGSIGLSAGRLVSVTVLILLFRRMPVTLVLGRFIPDVRGWRETAFAGWFGPIGVSAVYYAQLALKEVPEDRTRLLEVVVPVVYCVVIGSVIVHGISIPVLKYRTFVSDFSRTNSLVPLRIGTTTTSSSRTADSLPLSKPPQRSPALPAGSSEAASTETENGWTPAVAQNGSGPGVGSLALEGRHVTIETPAVESPPGDLNGIDKLDHDAKTSRPSLANRLMFWRS